MKSSMLVESREVSVANINDVIDLLETDFAVEHYPTTLQEVKLRDEGTIEFGKHCFPHTDHVHDKVVKACKIPLRFEQDLPFTQLNTLFEKRKHDKACPLTMCVSNGAVVGVAPAHYQYGSATKGVAKTLDVLRSMEFGGDLWEFESAIISDRGVKINLLIPGVSVEPDVDDIVKIGLEISNSETGGQSLKSDFFTLRLVCENGMTQKTDRLSVYYTKFGRMSYPSKIRTFVRKLENAQTSASEVAEKLYENIVSVPLMDADLLTLHRTIKRRVGAKLDADEVLGIEPSERFEIYNRVHNRDRHINPQPTDFLAWNVHNAITASARSLKLPLRRSLEELGGNVLFTAQRRWHEGEGNPFSLN